MFGADDARQALSGAAWSFPEERLDLNLPGRDAASVETHQPAVQRTLDTHKAKSNVCVLA